MPAPWERRALVHRHREERQIMTLLSSKLRRTHTAHLAAAMVVLVLALLTGATSASADIEGKFEGHLPGKTWTTNGAYGYMTFLWGETISGEGSVCVTPAEYSGGWSFPYGW